MLVGEVFIVLALVAAFCFMLFLLHRSHQNNMEMLDKKFDAAKKAIHSQDYREIDIWLAQYANDDNKGLREFMTQIRSDLFLAENAEDGF